MRALTIILAVAAALWGGYWFAGSRALDSAARGWFAGQSGAQYSSLSVAGFPNRFDLTVNDLHLEAPDGSLVWDAPFAQVFAMTWKPWHVIAALPDEQKLTVMGEAVTIRSKDMMGSLTLVPESAAGLNRISVVAHEVEASSDTPWTIGAEEVSFATRREADDGLSHQIGLRIVGLQGDPALMAGLLGQADLPPVIGLIRADATVRLTAPLDRFAAETQPKVASVAVRDITVTWGTLNLRGEGQVAAGADGLAEGRIDWNLTNWRAVPPALAAAGIVKPDVAPTVMRALEVMAEASPDPEVLTVPLILQSGRMSLGPLPLGAAPRLN